LFAWILRKISPIAAKNTDDIQSPVFLIRTLTIITYRYSNAIYSIKNTIKNKISEIFI
jgi:hypothetical protein